MTLVVSDWNFVPSDKIVFLKDEHNIIDSILSKRIV